MVLPRKQYINQVIEFK